MKTILALTTAGMALQAAQCGGGRGKPCETVVLNQDTAQVYASKGRDKNQKETVMVTTTKDTVSKPYLTCVTLYATGDTVQKPK